jgi:glutathione peroxidase-family protein
MDMSINALTERGRRKVAMQMADAVLFLVNVSSRAGFTTVRSKLVAVQLELVDMGSARRPSNGPIQKAKKSKLS